MIIGGDIQSTASSSLAFRFLREIELDRDHGVFHRIKNDQTFR